MANYNKIYIYCLLLCAFASNIKGDAAQRISRQKCEEYGNAIKPNTCIESSENQGTAKAGEYPHMALLGYEGRSNEIDWKCIGILISDQYVITAAHCIQKFKPVAVRLGELNIKSDTDKANIQDIKISQLIINPEYKVPSYYNDIGLIKLEKAVQLSQNIRPACLPNVDETIDFANQKFIKSGWALLRGGETTQAADLIFNKNVAAVSHEVCNKKYEGINRKLSNGIDQNTHLCLGEQRGICQIISGAPIQVKDSKVYCMHKIIGLVSFGKSICDTSFPEVSIKISPYVDWIESVVWPQ